MSIRAITLVTPSPSSSAAAVHRTLGWKIDAAFETFASITPPSGPPLMLNVPYDGQGPAAGITLHIASDDVDASFRDAVSRGATIVREPQDMDFGERSASISIDELPGVIIDFSAPLTP